MSQSNTHAKYLVGGVLVSSVALFVYSYTKSVKRQNIRNRASAHIFDLDSMWSIGPHRGNDDESDMDENTLREIEKLTIWKKQALRIEDYDEAKRCKLCIENLQSVAKELSILEEEKKIAVKLEDYDSAKQLKLQIDRIRATALNLDESPPPDDPRYGNLLRGSLNYQYPEVRHLPSLSPEESPPYGHYSGPEPSPPNLNRAILPTIQRSSFSPSFEITVTTVFRNLEQERIWDIDQEVRDRFNSESLYELALREEIPWKKWNEWVREMIVTYLRENNKITAPTNYPLNTPMSHLQQQPQHHHELPVHSYALSTIDEEEHKYEVPTISPNSSSTNSNGDNTPSRAIVAAIHHTLSDTPDTLSPRMGSMKMSWKNMIQCLHHELSPMISTTMEGVMTTLKKYNYDLSDKMVDRVLNGMQSRMNLSNIETAYIRRAVKRVRVYSEDGGMYSVHEFCMHSGYFAIHILCCPLRK